MYGAIALIRIPPKVYTQPKSYPAGVKKKGKGDTFCYKQRMSRQVGSASLRQNSHFAYQNTPSFTCVKLVYTL